MQKTKKQQIFSVGVSQVQSHQLKFAVGDQFANKINGKVYTGEVLQAFDNYYLVMWHHMLGFYYLPAEKLEQMDKINTAQKVPTLNMKKVKKICKK